MEYVRLHLNAYTCCRLCLSKDGEQSDFNDIFGHNSLKEDPSDYAILDPQ